MDPTQLEDSLSITPRPKATSTAERKKHGNNIADNSLNITENQLEESLGILSIHSNDISNHLNMSDYLQKSKTLAKNSLQRQSTLMQLPSQYLKPSTNESLSSDSYLNETSGSTVNESDLLTNSGSKLTPSNTSTPRNSFVTGEQDKEFQPRFSLGQCMTSFTQKILNPDVSLYNVVSQFKSDMNGFGNVEIDSAMFTPAEDAESKFLADELSWRKERHVPGQTSEMFSMNDSKSMRLSMGEFFKQRTEKLENLHLATSPIKKPQPQALIDDSVTFSEYNESNVLENVSNKLNIHETSVPTETSFSLSKIVNMLSQTAQTPNKLIEYFTKGDKKEQNTKQSIIKTDNSIVLNKENVCDSNIEMNSRASDMSSLRQSSPTFKSTSTVKMTSDFSRDSQKLSTADRSVSSVHTSGSLSSLSGGKLPIESTKSELIWGCVRAGKSLSQDVVIRNRSQSRVRFNCTISKPYFKLLSRERLEVEYVGSIRYLLQPGESKSVTVVFAPCKVGAAKAYMSFTPVDPNLQQSKPQKIHLYGYGGHGSVDLCNVTKDATGKFWLSLGFIENTACLSQKFLVQNTGSLPSFAYFSFESKKISLFNNVNINPKCLVLQPNEQEEVVITYNFSKDDYKFIQSVGNKAVIELGALILISGTEATRGRVRKVCEDVIKKGIDLQPLCNELINYFPNEAIPPDVEILNASISSIKELLPELIRKEILITLEQDPNTTLLPQLSDDETVFFQTICQDATIIENELIKDHVKFEPKLIILTPPNKIEDMFYLISEYSRDVEFNIQTSSSDIELKPKSGTLLAGNTVFVKVKCKDIVNKRIKIKICVTIENEVFESEVKILFFNTAS